MAVSSLTAAAAAHPGAAAHEMLPGLLAAGDSQQLQALQLHVTAEHCCHTAGEAGHDAPAAAAAAVAAAAGS
jgi:hypothetical protein